ncbi:pentatricopeptide repeat-containing protein At5g42450, mitochondrial [Impatiens glandulifera]|uniref:pentatricopeptide repeat-containing protein At5g42450, mitochondrial n=1 Tax=Impatiens glandulifera TaxID=253017 RepID=UPI001FB10AD2|nr:pentatricopeptide repeat-containing protein At5g42450, mitochondrial [Impatiens glandulifera]
MGYHNVQVRSLSVLHGSLKRYMNTLTSNGFISAHQMFDEMSNWDVVSATKTITRLVHENQNEKAISIFSRMLILGIRPNEFTLSTMINISIVQKDLNLGQQFHSFAIKTNLHSIVFVGSVLLNLYAKISTMDEASRAFRDTLEPNVVSFTSLMHGYLNKRMYQEALEIFQTMPTKSVVSWNAMISGYSQNGENEEAINLFIQMLREKFVPDHSSFPCTITAAANMTAVGTGRSLHACAVKFLGKLEIFVANSLISLYAKCGCIEDGHMVFDKLQERNIVSWNALITGYAQNGRGKEAIVLFEKMRFKGIRPNSVTYLGILLACNHIGFVEEGFSYFNHARKEDSKMLKAEHYACMVDLLSRSGRFDEAEKFISDLPFDPGIGFWKAVLGGCRIHSNVELGQMAARKILGLDPKDVSSYVMMSNAHAAAGRWDRASMVREKMKEKEMKMVPGFSWIEVKKEVHFFTSSDDRHREKDDIYEVVGFLLKHAMDRRFDGCFLI